MLIYMPLTVLLSLLLSFPALDLMSLLQSGVCSPLLTLNFDRGSRMILNFKLLANVSPRCSILLLAPSFELYAIGRSQRVLDRQLPRLL